MRADVGVPDLGLELHVRWSKRVLARDLDVDMICSTLIWCIWRPKELSAKMCEVVAVSCRLYYDLRELVVLDVGDLFGDPPGTIGGHIWREIRSRVEGVEKRGKD